MYLTEYCLPSFEKHIEKKSKGGLVHFKCPMTTALSWEGPQWNDKIM